MKYLKANKLEIFLLAILLEQIFLGAIKRLYINSFGRDQTYYGYLSLFPMMVIFAFLVIVFKRKMRLPNLGKSTLYYYLFILNAIIVSAINSISKSTAISLIHTYYILLLIPILVYASSKGVDLIKTYRTAFFISLPWVGVHTIIHATFGILPFEQSWAAASWSSLYIGNIGDIRQFRPFATFEDPGYLSAYYLFGAFSLHLKPLKSATLTKAILVLAIAFSLLPLKSSAIVAFAIAVTIVAITSKIKRNWAPRFLALATIIIISFSLTQLSGLNLNNYLQTNSMALNERLSLGTLKARLAKYESIFESIREQPLGHGADFVSIANIESGKGFIDSDSQYITILANFGVQGFLLYIATIMFLISTPFNASKIYSHLLIAPIFWLLMSFTTEILSNRFTFICISIFIASLIQRTPSLHGNINLPSCKQNKVAA